MLLSSTAEDVPPVSGSLAENILIIVFIIVLLFCSALMSGSEAAFFSLSPKEKEFLKNSDDKKSRRVISLLAQPNNLLGTILQANAIVNILIVLLSNVLLSRTLDLSTHPVLEFLVCTVIATFLLVLFGEAMPKQIGTKSPIKFSRFTSRALSILRYVTVPIDRSINYLVEKFNNVRPHSEEDDEAQKEEDYKYLSDAVDMTLKADNQQRNLLKRILNLPQKNVSAIMKPRVDVVTVNMTMTNEDVVAVASECGFSRLPVYKDNLDDIRGFIYIKDMLPFIKQKAADSNEKIFDWKKHIRKAFFVPGSMKISDLLEELRNKKLHLAIVVDEYGGMDGIATMEDILEEIVGEITDESDTEQ